MPERLSVAVLHEGEHVVVVASGEVDVATVASLRDSIEPLLGPKQMIVLDLSQVTFADSALLSVLVKARGELTEHGGSLLLRNPSTTARRLLTLSELDDLVKEELEPQEEDPV